MNNSCTKCISYGENDDRISRYIAFKKAKFTLEAIKLYSFLLWKKDCRGCKDSLSAALANTDNPPMELYKWFFNASSVEADVFEFRALWIELIDALGIPRLVKFINKLFKK